jgi:cyclase
LNLFNQFRQLKDKMLTRRVIPCLDVKNGEVVKGVNFRNLAVVGDPVELAYEYYQQGADELVFLDVSASKEGRSTMIEVVRAAADQIFIPLTVGGGVRTVEDVDTLLRAGADKVSINTAAISRPQVIDEIVGRFGSQVLVLSVDAKRASTPRNQALEQTELEGAGKYVVTTHGGTKETDLDALTWIIQAQERGVGEILLNSMDADGTKRGYDIEMINHARLVTHLPIIASGGAGKLEDFVECATQTSADAFLAASVFHYGQITVEQVKAVLGD